MGRFLKLSVYDEIPDARAAYAWLDLTAQVGETTVFLTGTPRDFLIETA
ncbi:hypothetical protein P775_13555 [Puniceibacterium antarcticum]|uniref:Uncharacterized protein n=1 Tax=Puniceibacterium antarcticum TaxID=1206336 RepID=A0A2G8RD89_9RHOB|nr:hypothetical protein [Puniceibacterium antarcticum]PIL19545.1 hypothetical protein P775_13555 [Puniceibacterium antarcticum]